MNWLTARMSAPPTCSILLSILIGLLPSLGNAGSSGGTSIFPEAHDPVLGDRAAVVDWAWSPQYAKRFGVPVKADGLKDGPLWLVGIKVLRVQSQHYQIYRCRIVGLLENKTSIIWPPGERYVMHPGYHWMSGLPGKAQQYSNDLVREVNGRPCKTAQTRMRHGIRGRKEFSELPGIGVIGADFWEI
ncbi:MAG: hypothetical protein MUE86_01480 [Thiobacillaceae bacterium]|nr:hypothetical protein [Thiobacillaceae bacterium]